MSAFSPNSRKTRLTQDEKTAETRRRLLDSAILCLIERGYANTTTSEVAERAGLSRGAQLYHFPRKEELLTNAVEHLTQLRYSELKEKVGRLGNEDDRRTAAIDLVWEMANGPLATAWLELLVASRTDSYLRSAVNGVNYRVTEFIAQSFKELFPRPESAGIDYELIPLMVVLLIEGMALEGMTSELNVTERILNALKTAKF